LPHKCLKVCDVAKGSTEPGLCIGVMQSSSVPSQSNVAITYRAFKECKWVYETMLIVFANITQFSERLSVLYIIIKQLRETGCLVCCVHQGSSLYKAHVDTQSLKTMSYNMSYNTEQSVQFRRHMPVGQLQYHLSSYPSESCYELPVSSVTSYLSM
jgi:hypothetical protein